MSDPARALAPVLLTFREKFGGRLRSFLVYGERTHRASGPLHTLALVDGLTFDDLAACAPSVAEWHAHGIATPLLLPADEFARSLDVFPLEYGEIIADHRVLAGTDPFADLQVREADLRRACEVQARSHLLHHREGYLEAAGRPRAVSDLIVASAPALAALLRNIARLEGVSSGDHESLAAHIRGRLRLETHVLRDVLALAGNGHPDADAALRLFPAYLDAVDRLARYADTWHAS
ncbi:MAG: hypothetical protein KGN76_12720 [Acidobacteriota bacterium]|nr:hypothetical protein [Acidobacteriota bacterium]